MQRNHKGRTLRKFGKKRTTSGNRREKKGAAPSGAHQLRGILYVGRSEVKKHSQGNHRKRGNKRENNCGKKKKRKATPRKGKKEGKKNKEGTKRGVFGLKGKG